MSLDFAKALKAPTKVDNWIVKLLIGGVLLCIPIANFIVLGYITKVVQNYMNGKEEIPAYTDIGGLFVTGAKLFVGCIIYAIPVGIIVVILSLLLSKSAALLSILTFIVEFAAGLIAIVMIANFAVDEKILSMVNFPRMAKFLQNNTTNFVKLILFVIMIQIVYAIVIMLCVLLVVTSLLIPLVLYAMSVSIYSLVGQFAQSSPKLPEIKAEA